jgi:hypothetical protein
VSSEQFTCLRDDGFYGDRCEQRQIPLEIVLKDKFDNDLRVILLHYILAIPDVRHQRKSSLHKMRYDSQRLITYVNRPFHIPLAELLNKTNYLIALREQRVEFEQIRTTLAMHQRCPSSLD